MSNLTRTRRTPAEYRLRPDGTTEIVYNASPEVVAVLPGTRWLEQRREREARLAAEAALLRETAESMPDETEPTSAFIVDTELTESDVEAYATAELPEVMHDTPRQQISCMERIQRLFHLDHHAAPCVEETTPEPVH